MKNETISKAEAQRRKDSTDVITNRLNSKLLDFKDMYLQSCINWNVRQIENRLNDLQKVPKVGTECEITGRLITERRVNEIRENNERMIKHIESRLSRKTLLSLEFINEGNESYNSKISKIVEKCVSYGMKWQEITVERIETEIVNEFSFIISTKEIEVHARVIYADGLVNVPHFRFITTKRNK